MTRIGVADFSSCGSVHQRSECVAGVWRQTRKYRDRHAPDGAREYLTHQSYGSHLQFPGRFLLRIPTRQKGLNTIDGSGYRVQPPFSIRRPGSETSIVSCAKRAFITADSSAFFCAFSASCTCCLASLITAPAAGRCSAGSSRKVVIWSVRCPFSQVFDANVI